MKLELVPILAPIPVSDVDLAKDFYAEKVGFDVDLGVDPRGKGGTRVV
jgi:predicted enzyme related to lactoylglutathione lyase